MSERNSEASTVRMPWTTRSSAP